MKSAAVPRLPAHACVVRLRSAGVADPSGPDSRPGDLLVDLGPENARGTRTLGILAAGGAREIDSHPAAAGAVDVNLGDSVVLPGLVNAHVHLDLTHIGPREHRPSDGFVAWVERIREGRAADPEAIAASVQRGVDLSLRAGTVLVGDIAGAPAGRPSFVPWQALARSPLRGVSFLEFFATGLREGEALARLADVVRDAAGRPAGPSVRLGLQPHAPNTVSLGAYREAARLAGEFGLPLCTHLAETIEEREFIARGTGPQREMLERFGLWTDRMLEEIGRGRTPIEHLAGVLGEARFLVAHVNDLGADRAAAMATLAAAGTSVAYCPRASEYFGAAEHFGPHAYREMLAAGVNVCLGTDSVVNLPAGVEGEAGAGLSVLDEARRLHRRDGTDPRRLLEMATINGARALGWEESGFSLRPGARPLGLVAVSVSGARSDAAPLVRALLSDEPARLLAIGE